MLINLGGIVKFNHEVQDGVVIMTIEGLITGGPQTTLFHGRIHKYLEQNKRNFIFDCKKVTWIDSVGLGMFISALTTIKNADGRLVLCNIEKIESALIITRLISVFEHHDSQKEALLAF